MSAETIAQRLLDTAQMRTKFPKWLCSEMEQAAEALQEAAADKLRLDWLSDRENTIGNVQLPTVCVMNNMDSLRGAIDEAMRLDPEIWNEVGGADAGETFNAV